MNPSMKMITLYIPQKYLEAIEYLINQKYFPNRSELIRVAIRDLILKELKINEIISKHEDEIMSAFLKDIEQEIKEDSELKKLNKNKIK